MIYQLTNIRWSEGLASLPERHTIEVPDDVTPYDLEQLLSDRLNDEFEAWNDGFEFEKGE